MLEIVDILGFRLTFWELGNLVEQDIDIIKEVNLVTSGRLLLLLFLSFYNIINTYCYYVGIFSRIPYNFRAHYLYRYPSWRFLGTFHSSQLGLSSLEIIPVGGSGPFMHIKWRHL